MYFYALVPTLILCIFIILMVLMQLKCTKEHKTKETDNLATTINSPLRLPSSITRSRQSSLSSLVLCALSALLLKPISTAAPSSSSPPTFIHLSAHLSIMAMQGDPNKNSRFFHHPIPIPRYVRPSYDATAGSAAAAGGGVDLQDQSDEFFMYIYKVKRCSMTWRHDWTECPYAHQGEPAQRRDPTKYRYSSTQCDDFRRKKCTQGEDCEYAHGIFESYLHPTRYRTSMCKNGNACTYRVCFFAHTPEELRCMAKPMRIETPALPAADLPSVAVPVPLAALPAADLPAVSLPAADLPALALPTVGAPSSSSKDGMDEERGKGSVGGDGEFLDFSEFGWVEELLAEGGEEGEGLGRGVE